MSRIESARQPTKGSGSTRVKLSSTFLVESSRAKAQPKNRGSIQTFSSINPLFFLPLHCIFKGSCPFFFFFFHELAPRPKMGIDPSLEPGRLWPFFWPSHRRPESTNQIAIPNNFYHHSSRSSQWDRWRIDEDTSYWLCSREILEYVPTFGVGAWVGVSMWIFRVVLELEWGRM